MSKRAILAAAGLTYGAAVIALSPWKSAYDGWRAVRALGEGLDRAMDAIAEETAAHIEETAGRMFDAEPPVQ